MQDSSKFFLALMLWAFIPIMFSGTAAGGTVNDFDGDGRSDIVVFRGGAWLFHDLASGTQTSGVWTGSEAGCIPAPMDYDGDGKVEFTQLCNGAWHFYNDDGSYNKGIWTGGVLGDLPVPADYDGDGIDDVVVFRGGAWLFYDFATGASLSGQSVWTGAPGTTSLPVPMDYDGDGAVDFTVFSGGPWHFYNDDGSYNKGIWTGGVTGDVAAPADYDGDRTEDVVVFRGGAWLFYDFVTGAFLSGQSVWTGAPPHWTGGTSLPAPLDYDGDGAVDFTVFSGGPWHFYNDDGSYHKGIWGGGVSGDMFVSRLPVVSVDRSQEFVEDLVDLDNQVTLGQISEDEFITQYDTILRTINNTPNGPELLQVYLEEQVLGYSFNGSADSTNIIESRVTTSSVIADIKNSEAYQMLKGFVKAVIFTIIPGGTVVQAGVIDDITNSEAYQILTAFVEAVIFTVTPSGTVIQATKPELFKTLSAVQVRKYIDNALFSNRIDITKAQELHEINRTNPYEAERQLLTALGEPIPSWLQPAPSGCLRNCTTPGVLEVSPTTGLSMSGEEGGPFTPPSQTYTLTNTGGSTITFSVSKGESWMSLSTTGGSLEPGKSTTVQVAVNTNATTLSATNSPYSDTVTFTNNANGGTTSRSVALTVNPKTLNWVVTLQVTAASITRFCSVTVVLPASGGSQSVGCDPATVTMTTVGVSTFQVSGTGFGSDLGTNCSGNGSGSGTIFGTTTGFSASGSLSGNVQCTFDDGSTQNFALTGSFSASALE